MSVLVFFGRLVRMLVIVLAFPFVLVRMALF
jgi:hypothetical protein